MTDAGIAALAARLAHYDPANWAKGWELLQRLNAYFLDTNKGRPGC